MINKGETVANNCHLHNHGFRVNPHGFFRVDAQWNVECWNREAEKLLLVPAIDIVGKNLWKKFSAVIPLDFHTLYHKASINSIPVYIQLNWAEMGGRFKVITYYFRDTLSIYFCFSAVDESFDRQRKA